MFISPLGRCWFPGSAPLRIETQPKWEKKIVLVLCNISSHYATVACLLGWSARHEMERRVASEFHRVTANEDNGKTSHSYSFLARSFSRLGKLLKLFTFPLRRISGREVELFIWGELLNNSSHRFLTTMGMEYQRLLPLPTMVVRSTGNSIEVKTSKVRNRLKVPENYFAS